MRIDLKVELHCINCQAEQFVRVNGPSPLDPLVRCCVCGKLYLLRQLTLDRIHEEESRLAAEVASTDFDALFPFFHRETGECANVVSSYQKAPESGGTKKAGMEVAVP
ncbi:MAG: hypothetical protein ABI434_02270 [Burkholderiaceae bacterium]